MTALPKPLVAHIYNPDNQTREQLIDSFVVRVEKFKRVFAEIKTTPDRFPVQHYVIEGKRGMGKTTFLLRLAYEIEDDPDLNGWLLPLVFNEEEYSIRKLYKLWERVAILLGEADKAFAGLFQEMDSQFDGHPSEDAYEEAMFKLLTLRLQERGKKIILFIDNFGDIFSRFSLHENQRLRTVLQTSPDLQIIAASSVVLEVFFEYKHPFYDFFKVIRLSGLSREENTALLLKLGETYKQEQIKDILANQPGRVEALRRLTGGVIRTVVLLFEIFIDKQQGSAFDDLEAILDRVSTLFKHRMDDLSKGSPEQGEIVNAVAVGWDAMTAEEIGKATRLTVEVVDKQLDSLLKNETLDRTLNPNGQHLYSVSERFFNIWYLMRHGRKGDKRRVLWLVRFLEEWCDEKLIVERAEEHIEAMKMGTYNVRGAYYMSEAIAGTKHINPKTKYELLKTSIEYLDKKDKSLAVFLKDNYGDFITEVERADADKWDYRRIVAIASRLTKDMAAGLYLFIGDMTDSKGDAKNAEKYYLKAIENGSVYSLYSLGQLYHLRIKDYQKAEQYYLLAIENGIEQASILLASIYNNNLKDFQKAEYYYIKAVNTGDSRAMLSLGFLFTKLKMYSKAEKYFTDAVENGNDEALFWIGSFYVTWLKDYDKGEYYYTKAFEKGIIGTKIQLLSLYSTHGQKFRNKEAFYVKILENGLDDDIFIGDDFYHLRHLTKFLLSRSHYPLLYRHFTSPEAEKLNLKDRLKPLWYALMYYMQDEHPNEYLRMGEELRETVQEIIAEVEEMRNRYGAEQNQQST